MKTYRCFGTHVETNDVCRECAQSSACIAVQKKDDDLCRAESKMKDEIDRLTRELAEKLLYIAKINRELADANKKIEESAYNCPSCGRHDFGLLSGPTGEVLRLHGLIAGWECKINMAGTDYDRIRREMREAAKGEK